MDQDEIQTHPTVSQEPALNLATAVIPAPDKAAVGLGPDIAVLPGPSALLVGCVVTDCIGLATGFILLFFCSAPRGDWLLRFVYRTSSIQINVAGLQPVDLDDRRMVNMDLSSVVSSTSCILIFFYLSFACSTVTSHSLVRGRRDTEESTSMHIVPHSFL